MGLFSDVELKKRSKFLGYGSLASPCWFVGMEEGLDGKTPSERETDLVQRFKAFRPTISEISERYSIEINNDKMPESHLKWFRSSAKSQRTWAGIIRIIKRIHKTNNDTVLNYQIEKLCRDKDFPHCLLEFSPFPCNNIEEGLFETIYGLKRRLMNEKYLGKTRIKQFQNVIKKYTPKLVIFYSLMRKETWKEIIGAVDLREESWKTAHGQKRSMFWAHKAGTKYFIIPHTTFLKGLVLDKIEAETRNL